MAELASAIGDDAARLLAERFGGTTISVPRTIGEHHPLHVVLGADLARRVAQYYGGSRVYIPKQAHRRARVLELHRKRSLTIAGIAVETGYSERHVYRLLGERDERQADLFGE